ncbi:matrix remodeling-associated protein 8-like isoform X2 [Myxocyprinus asiaticus]|uniref:matrix remodeling-associated protein 8-like isoform X2 n=1 Tax=Myxocyprinus asiaticus TaxID=70543 RepID=UPI002222FF4F|nr:matrix remodeling-associated protein 8-like isoform X2 [Myxocyprinus asiaticus]
MLRFIWTAFLLPCAWAQNSMQGVVVEARNITVPAGSDVILPCHNQQMVWRQDRLRDRQRAAHWDLIRNQPDYTVERVVDMFSGGTERLYNDYNKGRITISKDAFSDGNFSLVINNVDMNDKGIYTCNLHHHYCKVHQSIKIQLNITKSARKERRVWDGDKPVFVVLVGKSVVLPCVNRRPLWTDSHRDEGQQQVVHWDWQAPGVTRDRADRLIDMYASGENRQYGPLFLRQKMNISTDAFSMGDFSLSIHNIQPSDKGLYSCHLHHHYCGLHERRIFRVIVGPSVQPLPPARVPTEAPTIPFSYPVIPADDPNRRIGQGVGSHVVPGGRGGGVPGAVHQPEAFGERRDTNMVEAPHVLNVILPENQTHLLHQVGYILAIFLLLLLMLIGIIMTTRHCIKKEPVLEVRKYERDRRASVKQDATELQSYNQEDLHLDYKNNIMKERAEANNYPSPKVIDLNREMERMSWK